MTHDSTMPFADAPLGCSVCGFKAKPRCPEGKIARDSYWCVKCRALLRHRDIAQIILDQYGLGECTHLGQLVSYERFRKLSIYEVGIKGPIADRLKDHPDYVQSYYWNNRTLGSQHDGVYCQDLRALTFKDESFDLVISIDVLEHVFDPEDALSEIARVLKPGGLHVFSIPFAQKFTKQSRARAQLINGEIDYIHAPVYHVAGNEDPSLVVTDWGLDIVDMHERAGLKLSLVRRNAPHEGLSSCVTFVARK